jgi:hypothetical protein
MINAPEFGSTRPGRRITRTPAKPANTPVQRAPCTRSPRKSAAPIVTNSGPVNDSAAVVASGIKPTAEYHNA